MLKHLGVPFTVVPSSYVEDNTKAIAPDHLVREHSRGKAMMVAQYYPQHLVLAADTLVVCEGKVLGKPKDATEAKAMLQLIQGRWHQVYTGMTLAERGSVHNFHELTQVRMAVLSERVIDWYVRTGEPLDKSGAYGSEEIGAAFVEELRGCHANAVGLPLPLLFQELAARGWF